MFGNNKTLMQAFAVGTKLDGVTQLRVDTPFTFGMPTGISWRNHPRPATGLYESGPNGLTYFVLDCSELVTRLIPEYKPFRIGVDGVIMQFNVLRDHPTTNAWLTIDGK